jgi:hypothetical protein
MISEDVLCRLERGPARGLPKWPAMLREVRKGLVRAILTDTWPGALYELTDRGRRKVAGYRSYAAGRA